MRIDNTYVINGETAQDAALNAIQTLNDLGKELSDFFLYVIKSDNTFENSVTQLYFGEACLDWISDEAEITACQESLNQALKLGLFNLKEQIFKLLRLDYDDYLNTGTTTTDQLINLFVINDELKKWGLTVLDSFNSYQETYMGDLISNATNLQEILLVIYIFLITGMVIFFWLPYLAKLKAEVWRTTKMINMIPLDVVNNIPAIKRFLKDLIRKSAI